MQQPPFLLDTGQIPRMGFEPRQDPSSLEMVNEFTKKMESATEEAKSTIHKAQEDMTRYYNQRRSPAPMFQLGDWVYLDASDIKTTRPSPKLSHRRLGPFEIECQVRPLAYYLCHKLHSAISPSILRQFSQSQWLQKALEKTF